VKKRVSWKGVAVQKGLQTGNRGIAIVRNCYQGTAGVDRASCKRLRYAVMIFKVWR
jgi:hypothetical protein